MNFITIDFETANQMRESACSLALVIVKNGQIIDQRSWLLRPKEMNFSPKNVEIHGITKNDVLNAPTIKEIWNNEFCTLCNDLPIVAHNAAFDISVLFSSLNSYGCPIPKITSYCSFQIAQQAWPKLNNHRLTTLAEMLNLKQEHHNPLSDALVSTQIMLSACQLLGIPSIKDIPKYLKLSIDSIEKDSIKHSRTLTEKENEDILDNLWKENSFHYQMHIEDSDQIKRQSSARKTNIISIKKENLSGQINDYQVTLAHCTCTDFKRRKKPCKHMYRLAHELGIFDLNKKREAMMSVKVNTEILEVLSQLKNLLNQNIITKEEFEAKKNKLLSQL